MNSVFIIDDSKDFLDLLSGVLNRAGYKTGVADNAKAGLRELEKKSPDVVLLDLIIPGVKGMTLLEQIRKLSPASNVIMLTGHSGVKDAVKAMKLGAFDFIGKPFDNGELLMTIKRACENVNLRRELEQTRAQFDAQKESFKVLGESPAIRTTLKLVHIVAPTNMTVILQGESGVGKEVIANLIHQHSRRRDKPFVPVDCGTIPDQLTESILFGHEKGAFTGAKEFKLEIRVCGQGDGLPRRGCRHADVDPGQAASRLGAR